MNDDGDWGLIQAIHAAALDPRAWESVVTALSKRMRSPVVALYAPLLATGDAPGVKARVGMDDKAVDDYLHYYATKSPTFEALRHFPVGEVFSDEMLPDYRAYKRSEAYNDFFKPYVGEHILNLLLHRDERQQISLSIRRDQKAGRFSDAEIAMLKRIAPHLAHAVQVTRRLNDDRVRLQNLSEAVTHASAGILLINHDGNLKFKNEQARRILATGDGLTLDRQGMPRAFWSQETTSLRAAIRAATSGLTPSNSRATRVLLISRPSARRAYQVTVTPVVHDDPFLLARHSALVSIIDPESKPETNAQSLQGLYGLSRAECRFVEAFVSEASVERAAERLSLTTNSGRTYLKRIFQKTGAANQAELMKLVLLGSNFPSQV